MRTCTIEGCKRKHLAKGCCGTHYNRLRQTPEQRHPKVTVPCGQCGEPCVKDKSATKRFANQFCTFACREAWRVANGVNTCPADNRTSCVVPWRACPDCGLDWFRFGSQAARCDDCAKLIEAEWERRRAIRADRLVEVGRQMQPRPCDDCGEIYSPGTTVQRYCTRRCARRVAKRERRAREHGAQGSYTWTQVVALFLLFGRRCAYCAQEIAGQPDPDHVTPLSRGGHNYIGNILPACRNCNADKRDLPLHEWNADRVRRGLPPCITTWATSDRRYAHLTAQLMPHAA